MKNMTIKINKIFESGTHLPVLKAMLECFEPAGILELGAGENSTKFFYGYNKRVVYVETDK